MAIKGKTRSRGGKAVARGPKPVFVPARTPLLRRRGFWIGVLVVLVLGSAGGIGYGVARERSNQRAEDLQRRLASTMRTYQGRVDPILAGVGTTKPPAGFDALPALGTAIGDLRTRDGKPQAAVDTASGAADQAKTAAAALRKIDVPALAGGNGFSLAFVNYLINSKARFVEALDLYQQVASLIETASSAEGDQRSKLLGSAQSVLDTANRVFADGYNDYIEAQAKAKTFVPTLGASGAPGALGG